MQVCTWKSYDSTTGIKIGSNVSELLNLMLEQLQFRLGSVIVPRILAYLTASVHGISDLEMDELLSIDDDVLDEANGMWVPAIRRVQHVVWLVVRRHLWPYLTQGSAASVPVLYWRNLQVHASKPAFDWLLWADVCLLGFHSLKCM